MGRNSILEQLRQQSIERMRQERVNRLHHERKDRPIILEAEKKGEVNTAPESAAASSSSAGGGGSDTPYVPPIPYIWDVDALAFIEAADITDETEKKAINVLVIDLKDHNLWDEFYCLYPYVGGTLDSCKYNLKDPQDTDDAYRITWGAAVTTSSEGIIGIEDNVNCIGDTHFFSKADLDDENSASLWYYSKTVIPSGANDCNVGAKYRDDGMGINWHFEIRPAEVTYTFFYGREPIANGGVTVPLMNTAGFIGLSRESDVLLKAFRNGAQVGATQTTVADLPHPLIFDNSLYVLGEHDTPASGGGTVGGSPTRATLSFVGVGNGIDEDQVSTLNTIIQEFQTSLGREA